MATSKLTNFPKSTAEIEITIPWSEVKQSYESVMQTVVKGAEVSGFRKGKAPRKMVEEKIEKTKLYEEVIRQIVPKAYSEAIQQNKIVPVAAPKVDVVAAKENEDWVVKTTVALKPKVDLKNYKEKIQELKKSKVKIWTPGSGGEKKQEETKPTLDEIVKVLLEATEIELSDLLVADEANRLLSNLLDQTQKLGLTVEQYLLSKGKTSEQLRAEYALQAANNLKIEFILGEIADSQQITVTQKDLDELIAKVKDPAEQLRLKKDSYYLAHLIRQQKTIDYLNTL